MFGVKKTKKEVNGKNTYAVSFIGEDKMLGTDRDILTLRINSQIINFMNAYDHIDYYLQVCQPRIIRTPPKRRYFRALRRIRLRPYSKYEQSRL